MDYQPMGQAPNPVMNQTPEPVVNQAMGQEHSNGIWYFVGAVVIIALGFWYFYGTRTPATEEQSAETQASAVEQTQPALTGGNTTADISADLSQIVDASAALDADASAAASAISGL